MESTRQRYIYRSERQDGAVRRVYVGTSDSPAAAEYLQEVEDKRKEREQIRVYAEYCEQLDANAADLTELEALAMRERGYERTEQRKWRVCGQ
jgi:hypothetical protein